jgi:hypothetical protein
LLLLLSTILSCRTLLILSFFLASLLASILLLYLLLLCRQRSGFCGNFLSFLMATRIDQRHLNIGLRLFELIEHQRLLRHLP